MKIRSVIAILSAMPLMVSCNSKKENQEEKMRGSAEFAAEHTAQNSLDWEGIYEGVLPCADCEGVKTTAVLNLDGTFSLKEEYQKEPNLITESKGNFTWDKSGFVVSLEAENNEPRYFKVIENAILHLDNEKNEITGELAEFYRLAKK